jgi:hypothetical protein
MRLSRGASVAELEQVYRADVLRFVRVATAGAGDEESGADAVHDAFVQAVRNRRSFRGEGPLENSEGQPRDGQSRDGGVYEAGRPHYGAEHVAVVLFYGTLGDDPKTFPVNEYTTPLWNKPYVEIAQTMDRELLTRGAPMKYVPPEGSVALRAGVSGYLVRDGVYITIRAADDKLILDAARALRAMPSAGSGAGG